mgnify:CR=1 FL=1
MEGYRLLSDKRMWKIGTKGRYGFWVSVVTTMFDFVLLNVGYLYAIHNIGDVTTNESCMRTG